jgi:hypothetical protein
MELARVGRERSEYNSLTVVRSATHRPIMLWSHIFYENSEGKNNPSATPLTSLETVSNSRVRRYRQAGLGQKTGLPHFLYIPIRAAEASNIVQSARTEPLPSFRDQFCAFALVIPRIGGIRGVGPDNPVLILGWYYVHVDSLPSVISPRET